MNVGFIGLGNMGRGMAASLIHAGHRVTVYNRSPGKAQTLVQQGATAARTVAEASAAEVVFTMLADDAVASLPAGATHVSSSTIDVTLSQRLAAAHADAGQRYAAAPVFGRPRIDHCRITFRHRGGRPAGVAAVVPAVRRDRATHLRGVRPAAHRQPGEAERQLPARGRHRKCR